MIQVNVHQAKTQLSKLLAEVAGGEEVIIARAGQPVARLVAFTSSAKARTLDLYAGQIEIAADFDQLPEDLQAAFEGSAVEDPAVEDPAFEGSAVEDSAVEGPAR